MNDENIFRYNHSVFIILHNNERFDDEFKYLFYIIQLFKINYD